MGSILIVIHYLCDCSLHVYISKYILRFFYEQVLHLSSALLRTDTENKSIYFRSAAKEFHPDNELYTRKCSFPISIFKASVDITVVNNETNIRQREASVLQR